MSTPVEAAALGFKADVVDQSLAILFAFARPPETLVVAMDLARYVRVPLDEATWALVIPKRLRRLGVHVPPGVDPVECVREQTAGMAEMYTHTFWGQMDVREAQGHTFSRWFSDMVEGWFGKR